MIYSMTGFGKGMASSPNKKISVEVKSLNSKQLDLSLRFPSLIREAELPIRQKIAANLERGKVDVSIVVESLDDDLTSNININVLKQYKSQIEEMAAILDIQPPHDWYATLLRLPDALKSEHKTIDEAGMDLLFQAVDEAINNITESRKREGEKLYLFFVKKIDAIARLLKEIEPYEEERVPKIRARLEEQLTRLDSIEYDRARLEQELIYYIEKLDVNEEKLRLRSHLNYFIETLGGAEFAQESGQGKKLGFIAQEIGREINTLGSKSNHASMQQIVVKMKDELEQIKEQVLNVL